MRLGSRYRAELLRHLGADQVQGRVLDIGGFDGAWAAGLGTDDPCVVDLDVRLEHGAVRYVRGDAQRLPFPNASFDAAFALDVVEHVPDERLLISEAFRVLRAGGRFILTTPNVDVRVFPPFAQRWVNRRWQHERVTGFAPDYLRELIEPFASTVRVRSMTCRALRALYLPSTVLWRITPPIGSTLVDAAARWDSAGAEGGGGYVLAEATAR